MIAKIMGQTLIFIVCATFLYGCTKPSPRSSLTSVQQSQEIEYALLCSCIYDALEIGYNERQNDGSLGMYIQQAEFSINDFEELQNELHEEMQKSNLRSSTGATLNLAKCLESLNHIKIPPMIKPPQ